MIKKILIMGLPGSGKTTLAKKLTSILNAVHFDADEVRKNLNTDLGYSHDHRIEQARRMGWLCDEVAKSNTVAIADFVCPTKSTREAFGDAFIIWVDRIEEGRYEDTNKLFEKPDYYDIRVPSYGSVEFWATQIQEVLKLEYTFIKELRDEEIFYRTKITQSEHELIENYEKLISVLFKKNICPLPYFDRYNCTSLKNNSDSNIRRKDLNILLGSVELSNDSLSFREPSDCSEGSYCFNFNGEMQSNTINKLALAWKSIYLGENLASAWAELALWFANNRDWQASNIAFKQSISIEPISKNTLKPLANTLYLISSNSQIDESILAILSNLKLPFDDTDPYYLGFKINTNQDINKRTIGSLVTKSDAMSSLVLAVNYSKCQDYDRAYNYFEESFIRAPSFSLHHIVHYYGAHLVRCLYETKRQLEFGDFIKELHSSSAIKTLIPPSYTKEAFDIFYAMRQRNIEKGLQSVLLITQAKSASVSVGNIFGSGFGLPSVVYSILDQVVVEDWLKDYARGGACYTTHLQPTKENINRIQLSNQKKIIIHTRDPRQLLISGVEHYHKYPNQALTDFQKLCATDPSKALDFAIDEYFPEILDWIQCWYSCRSKLDILFTTYEDFLNNYEFFIARILEYYDCDLKYYDRSGALTYDKNTDFHIRKGIADEWKYRLSANQIKKINSLIPNDLLTFFKWN